MKNSKMLHRLLAIVMTLVMAVSMLPAAAMATQEQTDINTMDDQAVAQLWLDLAKAGEEEAVADLNAQLAQDEARSIRIEGLIDGMLVAEEISAQAEATAVVTAYKLVDVETEKQVDLKYYQFVSEATSLEDAVAKLQAAGANGGLIEISEGTLMVNNRQDIVMSNVTIKGAGQAATVITGDASAFDASLKAGSSEGKAVLGVADRADVKVMDLTIDGGECGGFYKNSLIDFGYYDFKTVRVNGNAAGSVTTYFENATIKGTQSKSNLMIGTSSTKANVVANGLTVEDTKLIVYGNIETTSGSTLTTVNSMLGGLVVGGCETLGAGYYRVTYNGVTAYTTIPYAIEIYEVGALTEDYINAETVTQGVSAAQAMTADLTTVIDGQVTLLYGKNCAEMKALAAQFKTALASLSDETNVNVQACLSNLTSALVIDNWHEVQQDGTCAVCDETGLEVPAQEPEVDVEVSDSVVVEGTGTAGEELTATEQTAILDRTITNNDTFKTVTGFDSDANAAVIEQMVQADASLAGQTPRIEIKATGVTTAAGVATKLIFDVTPMLGQTQIMLGAPVTFRLPVDPNTTATTAAVFHEDELMGADYAVQGDENGKYVEVESADFSQYAVDTAYEAPTLPDYVVLPAGVTVADFGTNTVTDGTAYYATLQAAVEAVAGNGGAVLYCNPGADVGALQHAPVTATLTVYGNGAYVSGGAERDFDIGNTDPSGGKDITADMTLTVEHLDGCGAWGAKATAHTVNLVFANCGNMGKVFITGTTGTLNITMTDCTFEGVIAEAVYSNADGAISLTGVDFSNLNKAINLNHKAAGTQTITLNGCTFTDCGNDVSADQIPVRVLSSVEGGKSKLTVTGCSFSGTPEGGADILLDYGVGTTNATVSTTGASVVVETEANVGTTTVVTEEDTMAFTNVVTANEPIEVDEYKATGTAPKKDGYVFAGWYADAEHGKVYTSSTGYAYAKQVAEEVLSIQFQITKNTKAESTKTDLRLLSTVDDLNYREVGFYITVGEKTQKLSSKTVYSSIVANDGGVAVEETPNVFHEQSRYFITYTVTEVPQSAFYTDIVVTPYWVTLDGTESKGVTRTLQVSEAF